MPVLRVFLRDLGFLLLLLAAIPSLILYLLGLPNGLISTLIYFQLIIIWIQAEISLRPQELYKSQTLPVIVLHRSIPSNFAEIMNEKPIKIIYFTTRNVSGSPAFNIMLSRFLSKDIPV